MSRSRIIPLPEFHTMLWDRSDRRHTLKIAVEPFAGELGIGHASIEKYMKDLRDSGRIKKLWAGNHGIVTYQVLDPTGFEDE